jgi:hypothetical protein
MSGQLPAQNIRVESRDGKAVIVRLDTLQTGETKETVEWKAEPKTVLQNELDEVTKYLVWMDSKINRLQEERKGKRQLQKELQKAIDDLDSGIIIETGIPDASAAPVQTLPKAEPKKKAKKTKE